MPGQALLRIGTESRGERHRFAARVLLDALPFNLQLAAAAAGEAGPFGLELPGQVVVAPSELEAVFASVSLERELRTKRQDALGRFDETATTWDSSKPWVDLLALELASRLGVRGGKSAEKSGPVAPATKATFSVHITHDVDRTTFREPYCMARSGGGLLGLGGTGAPSLRMASASKALLKGLERLLEYERLAGIGARFFLMSGPFGLGRHGSRTDSRWRSWKASARLIQEAGMTIGLHSSFAAKDRDSYTEELRRLEQALGGAVTTHRSHYLRFDTSRICAQLESAGIEHDFSFGYRSRAGFRSGCARVHRMFDLGRGREARLRAVPLLFMDSHLVGGDATPIFRELLDALAQVKEVGGAVSLLFHPEILLMEPSAWSFFERTVSACLEMGASLSGTLPPVTHPGANPKTDAALIDA